VKISLFRSGFGFRIITLDENCVVIKNIESVPGSKGERRADLYLNVKDSGQFDNLDLLKNLKAGMHLKAEWLMTAILLENNLEA
jgi:hypothetical protein